MGYTEMRTGDVTEKVVGTNGLSKKSGSTPLRLSYVPVTKESLYDSRDR